MSNKVLRELNQKRRSRLKANDGNEIVENAQQLLLEAGEKEDRILSALGLDHEVTYAKKLSTDATRTKLEEERYNKLAYTGAEVKELCNKYDLRILPASNFNGTIPVDLSAKVDKFLQDNDLVAEGSKFYIMAPTNQFRTITHVPPKKDPILFYRPGERTGHYTISETDNLINVHNWGNDFSFTRKWNHHFSKYIADSDHISNFARSMIILAALFIVLLFNTFTGHTELIIAPNIMGFILISIVFFFNMSYKKNHLNDLWNSNKV